MATPLRSSNTLQKQTDNICTPAKQQHHSSISKVRVVVRVRPFLPQEISLQNANPVSCVSVLNSNLDSCDEVTVHLKDQHTSRNECYKLDAYFGQEDNNVSQIFHKEVKPFIPGIFQGYNATVFAYGATGSGKTYTMQGSDEMPGLMPLAMSTILSMCQTTESTVRISCYEVYLDRCYDLLELKGKEISVFDDKDGQTHLRGLAQVEVHSMSEFNEAFSCAIQRRKVAHTGLNDVSSRSHGALVIVVSTPHPDGSGNVVTGKLNLIDLAGNEDNRRTCNEGIRLQESAKINQSLFALSNVIYALNNNKPRIPYRESKLTRILQDSLGGKSHALMVACLNPGEYQESVHTVSLAARSRHISNFVSPAQKKDTPNVKVDMEAKLRAWLESKGKTKSAQRIGPFGGSPFISRTPNSLSFAKKMNSCYSSTKPKTVCNQGSQYVARRNLFNNGGYLDSATEVQDRAADGLPREQFQFVTDRAVLELHTSVSGIGLEIEPDFDEPVQGEETITSEWDASAQLSPCSQKKKELRSPSRKVLSPINSNINIENILSRDQLCPVTPLTLSSLKTADNILQLGTPLDKFHSRSCNLKNSLVQEYIEFLNSASREQLQELKGIGQKMAEYIMELRETSPLKSLSDLEKIGLSSKQVHNMFGRAAREVLG